MTAAFWSTFDREVNIPTAVIFQSCKLKVGRGEALSQMSNNALVAMVALPD